MEQFPTNNPENTNQEPINTDNEEAPLSFSEHMAQKQNYEQAFKEAQDNGTLPEGIRDARDYQDYMEEKQAHEAEQEQANQEAEAEFVKRIEAAVNVIEAIKDPNDKDLATSMLGRSDDKDGPISLALDKITKYGQTNSEESFIDFLERERKMDDYGYYNKASDYRKGAYNSKEKMWQRSNTLIWGNKLQREMWPNDAAKERLFIKNESDFFAFDIVPGNVGEEERKYAATRLLAKTLISRHIANIDAEEAMEYGYPIIDKTINLEKMSDDDMGELEVLSEIYRKYECDVEKYTWFIIENTFGKRHITGWQLKEDDLVDNLRDCANARDDLKHLYHNYDRYTMNLARGQEIINDFTRQHEVQQ